MKRAGVSESPRVVICGAGSGAGLACAQAFAARGAELILCDWDGTALTRIADELDAFSRFCDASGERSVEIFAAEIARLFPSIDVLINAAGRGYLRALTMMRMSRALLPVMRNGSGYRLIANIAPAGGFAPRCGMFPYASSFTSFARLNEVVVEQCRGTGIDVACITPRILRAKDSSSSWSDQLYRLDRIDECEAANRILAMFEAERPQWRPPLGNRSA